MIPIRESPGHVSFSVKIQPRARKNAITGIAGDALKISITAPPVDGKANQAVIEFLSGILQVPRASITIASGETSRIKLIRVTGTSKTAVEQRLTQPAGG